jgi:hypothetical protein
VSDCADMSEADKPSESKNREEHLRDIFIEV